MITSINEFRKHLNSSIINEMSYASLQSEIDDLKQQLQNLFDEQDLEAGQKGDQWTDADANRYGAQMNKIERKIQTRQNYIDRLRSGSRKSSTPKQQLTEGEKITYNGEECTILYVLPPDVYSVLVEKEPAVVKLASTSNTTYQNKPVRVTNVEGNNVFINTWKDNGAGFNNFAKKVTIDELDGVIVVPYEELQGKPRTGKEPKAKPNRAVRDAISTLTKNMDSVKPSIDKFKERTPEQQATIFKSRFKMWEDIETIVAAMKQMGLITDNVTEALTQQETENYFPPEGWKPEGWSKERYTDGENHYFDENGNDVTYNDLLKVWHKLNNIKTV